MSLKMNPFVSRLIRGAAVAVLFAVAPGCGAPMEGEVEAPPAQAVVEAPTVHAQDIIPPQCDQQLEYERMLCQMDCGNSYSDCQLLCDQDPESDSYLCNRSCNNGWIYCLEQCDKKYCG